MAGAAAGTITASRRPGGSSPCASRDHIPPLVRRAGAIDRDEMRSTNNDGIDQALLVWMTLIAVTAALLLYASAAIPAFLWCAAQGQIVVLPFVDAVGGMARWIVGGLGDDPRTVPGLVGHREVLPAAARVARARCRSREHIDCDPARRLAAHRPLAQPRPPRPARLGSALLGHATVLGPAARPARAAARRQPSAQAQPRPANGSARLALTRTRGRRQLVARHALPSPVALAAGDAPAHRRSDTVGQDDAHPAARVARAPRPRRRAAQQDRRPARRRGAARATRAGAHLRAAHPRRCPPDACVGLDAAARLRGLGARAANGPLDLRRRPVGVGGLQRLRRRALLQPRRDRRRAAAAAAGRGARRAQHDRGPDLAARRSGGARRTARDPHDPPRRPRCGSGRRRAGARGAAALAAADVRRPARLGLPLPVGRARRPRRARSAAYCSTTAARCFCTRPTATRNRWRRSSAPCSARSCASANSAPPRRGGPPARC